MSPLALSLRFLQAQPDARLVALARDGHEPAFEALVRRYRRELFSYCRRLAPQSSSAEDALQQTLLQAWRALERGAEVRDVRPWLYRIAHNVTLNQLRAAGVVPQEIPDTGGGHEVEHLVEQRLQARAALAGMASLPILQRQAFVSTTLDGASHEEVASALGLSSGAVRGLIYRARATLRAAAAALIPSPALSWAIRRAEARAGATGALSETLAGGSGAGVAAMVMKGGAVLSLAGAVAGGGVILAHSSAHHRHHQTALVRSAGQRQTNLGAVTPSSVATRPAAGASVTPSFTKGRRGEGLSRHGTGQNHGHHFGSHSDNGRVGGGPGGGGSRDGGGRPDGGSQGGPDGGSSNGSTGSSDGGSTSGAVAATSGRGPSEGGSSGSSAGSSGDSGGSRDGSSSGSSGSDGGSSGGSPTTTGAQATTTQVTVDGSSGDGSSGGGSGGSGSSGDTSGSGSSDGTTSGPH